MRDWWVWLLAILIGAVSAGMATRRFEAKLGDFTMMEKREFGGYVGSHYYVDDAVTIEYGAQINGSKAPELACRGQAGPFGDWATLVMINRR